MRLRRTVVPAFCCALLICVGTLRADIIMSITGSFATPDDVYTKIFTVTQVSEVNIQTWGYGGGTNASNVVIPSGGFDPAVALFLGSGLSATLFDSNDDGICPPGNFDTVTGGCLDSTLMETGLLPGTYTLALTVSPNFPKGPTLGDGFTGGGDFVDVFGNSRTNRFAVDIVTTPAVAPVPEPSTFGLVASCLVLLASSRIRGHRLVSKSLVKGRLKGGLGLEPASGGSGAN